MTTQLPMNTLWTNMTVVTSTADYSEIAALTIIETHFLPFKIGSILFYVLIVLGGGSVILTFYIIIVCVVIGFLVKRKRQSHAIITASTQRHHNSAEILGCQDLPQNQGICTL